MTALDDRAAAYAESLAWLATHGVNIYQFLGEQHIDDAKRFAEKPVRAKRPSSGGGRRKPRVIRYKGPGFSKA